MSSRVVLEKTEQNTGKLRIILFFVSLRERGSRVIARLVVQSRRRALFRILKKNQRIELDYNEVVWPSGKDKILPRKEAFLSKSEQEAFSLMAFVYFRNAAAIVLGKTKESYSTVWITLVVLCHVAEEISLLDEKKKKEENDDDRKRERKKLDNSEVKQQKR